jgi:hypothetical protein
MVADVDSDWEIDPEYEVDPHAGNISEQRERGESHYTTVMLRVLNGDMTKGAT